MTHKNLLQNVYLFRGLSADQMEAVGTICDVETFPSGEDVFSEGDKATALYIVKYGSVRIHTKTVGGDNIEIANLGTGSHFGEIAFLDGEKRSATATALEKSGILRIEYSKFVELLGKNPGIAVHVYRELAKFLGGRLRITTTDLGFAREQNLSHF